MSAISDRRIDFGQLRALYGLLRTLSLRGQRDSTSGKIRARPLLLVPTYLLFGTTTFPTIFQSADPKTAMTLVGAQLLGIGTLSLVPEALDTTMRRIEILHTKPIGELTFAFAQVIAVLTLLALVIGSLSVPPIVFMSLHFDLDPIPLFGWAALIGLLVFSLQSLWLGALWAVARRIGYERTRGLAQGVLILTLLSSWIPGTIFRADVLESGVASFGDRPYLEVLPSAWAAALVLPGPPGFAPWALLALVMISLFVRVRSSTRDHQRRLIEAFLETSPQAGATPLAARIAGLWPSRRPVAKAIAKLILVVMAREDHPRLRRFSLRAMIMLTVPAAFLFDQGELALAPAAMIGALLLTTELDLLEDSQSAGAGVALAYAPLERRDLYGGVRLALIASTLTFTAPLLCAYFFFLHPPVLAAQLLVVLALWGHAYLSLLVRFRDPKPLSHEPRLGARFATTISGMLLFFGGALIYGLVLVAPWIMIGALLLLAVLGDRAMAQRSR